MQETRPQFNLWVEPWIGLETRDGQVIRIGIEQTLLQAQHFTSLYDPSPLVIVGIHRLLVAVLQSVLHPKSKADIRSLWRAGCFPENAVRAFGEQFKHRFDLFSETEPFLQSGDIPTSPLKKADTKTVAYLTPETPSGTAVTHFRHGSEDAHFYCQACLAAGLVTLPAFSTSGGSGIKPSINGVPPIYILPGGETLFESLLASLLLPNYQPSIANREEDMAWWVRKPLIQRSSEVQRVGYLHSLTFAARRVRLHPQPMQSPCTRCGQLMPWGASQMTFEMGESRPKDAELWFDPFAAYKANKEKKYTPIRPTEGKATWREFSSLFLHHQNNAVIRPAVLDQITEFSEEGIGPQNQLHFFRCIGMRTDMKAKIFEWVDTGFDVPAGVLRSEDAGVVADDALKFADDCEQAIKSVFRQVFGGKSKKSERNLSLKKTMTECYWAELAPAFRRFMLRLAAPEQESSAYNTWLEVVVDCAFRSFQTAAEETGDDAEAMRMRIDGERRCRGKLYYLLNQERNTL